MRTCHAASSSRALSFEGWAPVTPQSSIPGQVPASKDSSSHIPPLSHVPGCLQEPRVVILLQDVLCLVDEDRGALQALPAVGDLLGQLPQLHHLQGGHSGPQKGAQKPARGLESRGETPPQARGCLSEARNSETAQNCPHGLWGGTAAMHSLCSILLPGGKAAGRSPTAAQVVPQECAHGTNQRNSITCPSLATQHRARLIL